MTKQRTTEKSHTMRYEITALEKKKLSLSFHS